MHSIIPNRRTELNVNFVPLKTLQILPTADTVGKHFHILMKELILI